MKNFYNVLFISAVISLLSSCDNTTNPTIPTQEDEVPLEQLAIIKLTPELQERVFVSPVVDSVFRNTSNGTYTLYYGDKLVLINPNLTDSILAEFAQSQLGLIGTNPYILLEDGYALIDWKWSHYQPLSGEGRNVRNCYCNLKTNMIYMYSTNQYIIKNEQYYLLPIKWNELKDITAQWEINEGQYIEKPQICYINTKDIENYGDMSISSRQIWLKYNTPLLDLHGVYNLYNNNKNGFNNYKEQLDLLQASYVEILNQMINNKDFDKWARKR